MLTPEQIAWLRNLESSGVQVIRNGRWVQAVTVARCYLTEMLDEIEALRRERSALAAIAGCAPEELVEWVRKAKRDHEAMEEFRRGSVVELCEDCDLDDTRFRAMSLDGTTERSADPSEAVITLTKEKP